MLFIAVFLTKTFKYFVISCNYPLDMTKQQKYSICIFNNLFCSSGKIFQIVTNRWPFFIVHVQGGRSEKSEYQRLSIQQISTLFTLNQFRNRTKREHIETWFFSPLLHYFYQISARTKSLKCPKPFPSYQVWSSKTSFQNTCTVCYWQQLW